jgi:predicted permease
MSDLLAPLVLVIVSLAAGYVFGRLVDRLGPRAGRLPPLLTVRKMLQRIALLVINPVAFLGAVWVAPLDNLRIAALPAVATAAILSGIAMAWVYAKLLRLNREDTGSILPLGGFTNIGSIGALVVFFFLGEPGFSLVPLYKLFEELTYYGIGFPLAKSFSRHASDREHRLKALARDPFIITMLSAIAAGMALNFSGIERPGFYAPLNAVLIPLASILLLASIGMAFRFSRMKPYVLKALGLLPIRTIIMPLVAFAVARLFGLHRLENGLVIQTVMIIAPMPAAFISLVPPTVYDLNIDLANTGWLVSMLSMLYTLPLLALILPLL